MKVLMIVLSFIVFFIASQYTFDAAFQGHPTIKTLFSLTLAAIFVLVGFGAVDTFVEDTPEDPEEA